MTTTTTAPAPITLRSLDTGKAITISHDEWLDWLCDGRAERWYTVGTW